MATITVDYMILMWMVIILFGMVGYFRGWWKEGISTAFLTVLVLLLQFPGLAVAIINTINKFIKLVYIVIMARSLDIERIAEVAKEIGEPPIKIDPTATGTFILALIIVLIVSYLVGRISINKEVVGPTFLGSLFGTIFGLLNGFTVISLLREYVVGRYLPGASDDIIAQGATTTGITLAVQDMPTPSIMEGLAPWLIISIGAVLLFGVVAARWGMEPSRLKSRIPPLYRTLEPKSTSVAVAGVAKTE